MPAQCFIPGDICVDDAHIEICLGTLETPLALIVNFITFGQQDLILKSQVSHHSIYKA